MSMNFGGENATASSTYRGRDWPCLRQFCVFLENRVGRMHDLLRHLESDNVRVIGLCIVDSVDFAVARLVLNNYERAKELLEFSEFMVFEHDIIGVHIPDDSQPYVALCTALLQAEVNIHYTYPLLFRKGGRGAIAIYVDDIDQGLKTLEGEGHTIITENDLLTDDEFL